MIARCPICRKPSDSKKDADFPFCSERCRLLDLGNWASEKYRISHPVFDESELEGAEHNASSPGDENHDEDDARGNR
jgi:endogenous inhibitor of DNA gyrase (YacG/DUF329 family)